MLVAFIVLALQLNSELQVNAQVAPEYCKDGVMSPRMRQAALDVHNTQRSLLARGQVKRSAHSPGNFRAAENMLAMEYNCSLERRALQDLLEQSCQKIPSRTEFADLERNYRYINTTIRRFMPETSPEVAIVKAAHEWWDLHLYNDGFKGVTPQSYDYHTIPFFLMAKAETPTIGCAIDLCPINHNKKFYAVLCYYGFPNVKVNEPLYKEGEACFKCPPGYECDFEKSLCKKTRR